MKNLLVFLFIGFGVWKYFLSDEPALEQPKRSTDMSFSNSKAMKTLVKAKEISKSKKHFKCDGRQHCSQMSSYEEAKYFIDHCSNTKMDGDHDGIPCERQF